MNGFTDRLNQITPLNKRVFYIVWAALFIVPTLFTKIATSQYINGVVILGIQFLIIALTWKQTILGARLIALRFPVVFTLLFITLVVGFPDSRNQVYLVSLLFVFSLTGQFQILSMDAVFIPIIKTKAWIIFAIAMAFSLFYLLYSPATFTEDLYRHMLPLYRHLRHFNYELIFVIPIVSYLILKSNNNTKYIWLAMSAVFMYYSLASGGRGQGLALVVIGIIVLMLKINLKETNTKLLITSIVLGFILVFVTGQHEFLVDKKVSQTVDSSSVTAMSSGRLKIWSDILMDISDRPIKQQLVGGNYESSGLLYNIGYKGLSQPHNTPLQALIEYGYLGLFFYGYLSFLLLRSALRNVMEMRRLNLVTMASATLIGVWVFSLTDGLYYHGLPLTMNLIFIAVLVHFELTKGASTAKLNG